MSPGAKVRSKKMPEGKVALLLRLQQGLKDRLADLAKREHRSLNQQIEFLLEQALSAEVKKPQNDQQGAKSATGKS
jgi:hypothetical protein